MRALSILLVVCFIVTGCAPSLRPEPGTPTASREECESIDSSQQTYGTFATWVLLIAGSVGMAGVFLGKSDEARAGTGGVAAVGAYSGALLYGQQTGKVREYRDKKCAAYGAAPAP